MKFAFIAEKAGDFGVVEMCTALGVATSGYYAWKKRAPSAHAVEDQKLRVHAFTCVLALMLVTMKLQSR